MESLCILPWGHYSSEPTLSHGDQGAGGRYGEKEIHPHSSSTWSNCLLSHTLPLSMSVVTHTLETLLLLAEGNKCQNRSLSVAFPLGCFQS